MRFYSVQVRILPRLIWGIGAPVLAHYEFKPPAPDWIGGIILTLIALWCFAHSRPTSSGISGGSHCGPEACLPGGAVRRAGGMRADTPAVMPRPVV